MVELLTPLHFISRGFPRYLAGDDDTVVIYHLKGTDRLELEFGTVPPTGIWVQIVENPRNDTMFPNLTVLSAITVPVDDISDMCDDIDILPEEHRSNDTVFVDWKDGLATFEIGNGEKWAYQYSRNERTFQGWFSWKYMTYMKEASFLADKARVLFLTVPEQHVLFQFHIGESTNLFLLQKARLVSTDMSAEVGAPDEDVVSNSVTLDTLYNSWLH
ncbi:uncharacterized protein LOC141627027 [Silene latifolia]|uniref:uncharacterized protein LOC141627027 n=1 Tax=Silene latifolia TaxID=37657 RepID=UPI003D774A71